MNEWSNQVHGNNLCIVLYSMWISTRLFHKEQRSRSSTIQSNMGGSKINCYILMQRESCYLFVCLLVIDQFINTRSPQRRECPILWLKLLESRSIIQNASQARIIFESSQILSFMLLFVCSLINFYQLINLQHRVTFFYASKSWTINTAWGHKSHSFKVFRSSSFSFPSPP